MTKVVDTQQQAEKMFRTFMARDPSRRVQMKFSWPKRLQEVGVGKAVMYRSNKWKTNRKEWEDYKHIAEAWQTLYVTPGFLVDWHNPRRKLDVSGPMVSLQEPMPKHFSVLAPLLGVQVQLDIPGTKSETLYEVVVKHGMLGGARHPKTNEPFLFVYTATDGVHMLLTGTELDVEKDGIVG